MAADETLVRRVRAALERAPDVEEKKMFGGLMFMVGGRMCIGVGRNRLMCRIDPVRHDAALEREGCRTMTMNGREYRGYVHVDRTAVKSSHDLAYWIRLALDYNTAVQQSTTAGARRTGPRGRRASVA